MDIPPEDMLISTKGVLPMETRIMKIPFRLKFFVVLLAFSLGPILLSRGIMGGAAHKVQRTIADETRAEMLAIVQSELEQQAATLLNALELRGQIITLALRMLAQKTEQALFWPPEQDLKKPYFTKDFGMTGEGPPDLFSSNIYTKRTRDGEERPLDISLEHPAFRNMSGKDTPETMVQIRQLQGLLPTFKLLYKERAGAACWYNVTLESGVFATYPGHGRFPMHYDSRQQEWYKNAKTTSDNIVWSAPIVDPATRRAITTGSFPIRDLNGEFLGATSLDIPITDVLNDAALTSRWSKEIKSFMVIRHTGTADMEEGLFIVAQHAYENGNQRHWRSGIETEWMTSDDPEAFKRLLEAMKTNKAGTMNLPYKGEDSLWAYASNDDFSFLLIAPEWVVAKLPDEMAGSVTKLLGEMRNISSTISGIMLIIIGIIAWFGSKRMTRPILSMAKKAQNLAKGDFSVRINHRFGDERDALTDSFNDMVPQLKERLHMQRDLELAQGVQSLLLPTEAPPVSGFDLSGGITYCDQTGGDYYDFIKLRSDNSVGLGVVLGDVSGHGAPAALIMAAARGQLHALSSVTLSPAERINTVNTLLSRDLDGTGRFITMFYLRLDENSPSVRWVRAGHDPAIRYCPATDTFSELDGEGLALGVLEEFEYQDYETSLQPGEILSLATDGVWEARNADGEMFGKQRMLAIIRESAHKSAEEVRVALMTAVNEYQAGGQADDMAVIVIKKDSGVL